MIDDRKGHFWGIDFWRRSLLRIHVVITYPLPVFSFLGGLLLLTCNGYLAHPFAALPTSPTLPIFFPGTELDLGKGENVFISLLRLKTPISQTDDPGSQHSSISPTEHSLQTSRNIRGIQRRKYRILPMPACLSRAISTSEATSKTSALARAFLPERHIALSS